MKVGIGNIHIIWKNILKRRILYSSTTMGRQPRIYKTLLTVGALLSSSSSAMAADSTMEAGGLRRKRSSNDQYRSRLENRSNDRQAPQPSHELDDSQPQHQQQPPQQRLTEQLDPDTTATSRGNVGDDLARRFFLPPSHQKLDDIDMRQLILEMNFEGSLSIIQTAAPTQRPTMSPTFSTAFPSVSTAPTMTSCDNPGTCENRLAQQIYEVSVRVGTVETLDDPNSPQSQASSWILEECDADIPIDPCSSSQLLLNEQRYALAVMYFSLGGDSWNAGSNPMLDKAAPAGSWMSGLNYCEWGTEISGANGSYNQLICDEFGNVLNLNLRK